jgi:hypothetical protein
MKMGREKEESVGDGVDQAGGDLTSPLSWAV